MKERHQGEIEYVEEDHAPFYIYLVSYPGSFPRCGMSLGMRLRCTIHSHGCFVREEFVSFLVPSSL